MSNRIDGLFTKGQKILSLYYTAGFPKLNDTLSIAKYAQEYGANLLEIGIPFSDPVADGPVIQGANEVALKNGMSIDLLFTQLKELRSYCSLPVVLMGYWNPILQYGIDKFLKESKSCGVDGVIIPDLPVNEFESELKPLLQKNSIYGILLITPVTPSERIKYIDSQSSGFIYAVSSPAITGKNLVLDDRAKEYFIRIKALHLKNPVLVGFGISNKESFNMVSQYADGGIIGSAFINALSKPDGTLQDKIQSFIKSIL